MNKSTSLILIVLSFCCLSCDTEEELTKNTELDFIIGTWQVQSAEYVTFVAGVKATSGSGVVSGDITFFEDGTGKENYTITIAGETSKKDGMFRFENNDARIIFDKGTAFENTWFWLENKAERQVAKYDHIASLLKTEITIVLGK